MRFLSALNIKNIEIVEGERQYSIENFFS